MGLLDSLKSRNRERKELRELEKTAYKEAYRTEVRRAVQERGRAKARERAKHDATPRSERVAKRLEGLGKGLSKFGGNLEKSGLASGGKPSWMVDKKPAKKRTAKRKKRRVKKVVYYA